MAHLALEAKESIVARALSRSDISLQQIAEESNGLNQSKKVYYK